MIQRDQDGKPIRFDSKAVCFVEGETDQKVLESLFHHRGCGEGWDFFSLQNKDAWPSKLKAISAVPGFERVRAILLVRDADNDRNSSARAITQCCSELRWPDPTGSAESIARAGGLAVGYYLWNGPSGTGELEDQCMAAIDSEGRLDCVRSYFDCLRLKVGSKESKRRLQAYFAGLSEYCPGIKTAAQMDVLRFSDMAWDPLAKLAEELVRVS